MYKSKLGLLEEILKVPLTKEQEDTIHDGWRAFWDEPEAFKDDVVVDMVLLDLGLTPNGTNKKMEERKMLGLKDDLSTCEKVNLKHVVEDGTLGWGKIDGRNFYVRTAGKGNLIMPATIGQSGKISDVCKSGEPALVGIIFQSSVDYIIYVINTEEWKDASDVLISDITPFGYQYYGIVDMVDGLEAHAEEQLKFLQYCYIPMCNAGSGATLPVAWMLGDLIRVPDYTIRETYYKDIIQDGAVSIDAINTIFEQIRTALPSIENPEPGVSGARYAVIEVQTGKRNIYLGYNRNHIAQNGNIDSMKKIMCIVLEALHDEIDYVTKSNLARYVAGAIDQDTLVIGFDNSGKTGDEPTVNGEQKVEHKDDGEKRAFSENPLIRAAQRGDTRYN
mgnify:CR=1 FL=1